MANADTSMPLGDSIRYIIYTDRAVPGNIGADTQLYQSPVSSSSNPWCSVPFLQASSIKLLHLVLISLFSLFDGARVAVC